MTLESWKEEFASPSKTVLVTNILETEILAWSGLARANLLKHDVYVDDSGDVCSKVNHNRYAVIGSGSPMCSWYWQRITKNSCLGCPLYMQTGKRCDEEGSLLSTYLVEFDPEPMIFALTKAHEAEEGRVFTCESSQCHGEAVWQAEVVRENLAGERLCCEDCYQTFVDNGEILHSKRM